MLNLSESKQLEMLDWLLLTYYTQILVDDYNVDVKVAEKEVRKSLNKLEGLE